MGASLLDLPAEVIVNVYAHLPVTDRLTLRRTCPFLRHVHDGAVQLQYDLTLQTRAYLDIPFEAPAKPTSTSDAEGEESQRPVTVALTKLSSQEKNELLSDQEKRWNTMSAKEIRTLHVAGRAWIYELQEGIFLLCHDQQEWDEERPTAIQLIPLPSAEDPGRDNPLLPPIEHRLPFGIADLTMDPTQDLIVVSEYRPSSISPDRHPPTHRYHLLTLSTLQPHPLAQLPTLDFPPQAQLIDQTQQLLQVMGDSLVVLVCRYAPTFFLQGMAVNVPGMGHEEELVAWNWKTGQVLARMELPENGWFSSFALLSPTTFMVTSSSPISNLMGAEAARPSFAFPPCIQIYSFAQQPGSQIIPAQPLEADYMDDTTPRPVLLAQLGLPALAADVSMTSFAVRPDPAFPPPGSEGPSLTRHRKHFTQDPSKGLLVFDLQMSRTLPGVPDVVFGQSSEHFGCELFVLRETLVRLAEEGEERMRSAVQISGEGWSYRWDIEKVYPWDEWGKTQARMLDVAMKRRNWVCSCSGYRYISLDRDPASGPVPTAPNIVYAPPYKANMRLFDFSPCSVRRLAATQGDRVGELVPVPEEDLPSGSPRVLRGVFLGPSVMPHGRIWRDDVVSSLPYVVVVREEGVLANGVMIDDQRIMLVAATDQMVDGARTTNQIMSVHCM